MVWLALTILSVVVVVREERTTFKRRLEVWQPSAKFEWGMTNPASRALNPRLSMDRARLAATFWAIAVIGCFRASYH